MIESVTRSRVFSQPARTLNTQWVKGESQVPKSESTPRSGVNASTMALERPSAWI